LEPNPQTDAKRASYAPRYSWSVIADTREQLDDMIKDVGLEATIDGELGIIVSKLEDATADDVVAVLNGIDEAKSEVLQ